MTNDRPKDFFRVLMGSAAICGMVSGCVTSREQEIAVKPQIAHAYLENKPLELRQHFYIALSQDQRNRVLNDMRLGLATMEMSRFDLAEELFDDALSGIEAVYADSETAKKARELFTKELVKDFKGEPYERTMAYYYRGLLYLRQGDYDNARASFKGGMLQDAFAEDDQNRSDFALMAYMQGWAAQCSGNISTASDDFEEFRTIFQGPRETAPIPDSTDNVLVLVETGNAPAKFSATDPNSSKPRYLKFLRSSSTETARVDYTRAGSTAAAEDTVMIEDIYRQAATRGGREFDAILAGKAQFKSTANTVGNVALVGAAAAAAVSAQSAARYNAYRNNNDSNAAAGAAAAAGVLLIAGLIAKSAAEAAEPNADTRYWDNLPDRVHGLPINIPASVDSVTVEFLSAMGDVVRHRTVPIWRSGKCGLAWVRGESALPRNPRAPFSAPPVQMAQPVMIPDLPAAPPTGSLVVTNPAQATPPRQQGDESGATENAPFSKLKGGIMGLFSAAPAASKTDNPTDDTSKQTSIAQPDSGETASADGKQSEATALDSVKEGLSSVKEGFLNIFGPKPAKADESPSSEE